MYCHSVTVLKSSFSQFHQVTSQENMNVILLYQVALFTTISLLMNAR